MAHHRRWNRQCQGRIQPHTSLTPSPRKKRGCRHNLDSKKNRNENNESSKFTPFSTFLFFVAADRQESVLPLKKEGGECGNQSQLGCVSHFPPTPLPLSKRKNLGTVNGPENFLPFGSVRTTRKKRQSGAKKFGMYLSNSGTKITHL